MLNETGVKITKELLEKTDHIHPSTALQLIETLEEAVGIIDDAKGETECLDLKGTFLYDKLNDFLKAYKGDEG
jgi:hypothetical protein